MKTSCYYTPQAGFKYEPHLQVFSWRFLFHDSSKTNMIYHGSCNHDLVFGDLHIISPATPTLIQCLFEKSHTGSVNRKNNCGLC